MAELGIDNSAFIADLAELGFDVYPAARAERRWTELTLLAVLTGTTAGVPEGPLYGPAKRPIRAALNDALLPYRAQEAGYEYVVIDAPIGHTTYSAGRHIHHGGINPFEERLLSRSLLGPIVDRVWPTMPTDSLRAHASSSIESLIELADPNHRRLVLAHLLVPHTPFLWGEGGEHLPVPSQWPNVQLFESAVEDTGWSVEEFADGLRLQLETTNQRVLGAMARIVEQDPESAVIIFSDHGARYRRSDQSEWYRSFLAARTPQHPKLFADDPRTAAILRDLLDAYGVTGRSR